MSSRRDRPCSSQEVMKVLMYATYKTGLVLQRCERLRTFALPSSAQPAQRKTPLSGPGNPCAFYHQISSPSLSQPTQISLGAYVSELTGYPSSTVPLLRNIRPLSIDASKPVSATPRLRTRYSHASWHPEPPHSTTGAACGGAV